MVAPGVRSSRRARIAAAAGRASRLFGSPLRIRIEHVSIGELTHLVVSARNEPRYGRAWYEPPVAAKKSKKPRSPSFKLAAHQIRPLTYRLTEEGQDALYAFTFSDAGHLQMAIYFDDAPGEVAAFAIARSVTAL